MSDKPNGSDMPENVALQFERTHGSKADTQEELQAEQNAEAEAPGEYVAEGLDRHDVGVEDTMIASDPPSTNMGGDDGANHGKKQ